MDKYLLHKAVQIRRNHLIPQLIPLIRYIEVHVGHNKTIPKNRVAIYNRISGLLAVGLLCNGCLFGDDTDRHQGVQIWHYHIFRLIPLCGELIYTIHSLGHSCQNTVVVGEFSQFGTHHLFRQQGRLPGGSVKNLFRRVLRRQTLHAYNMSRNSSANAIVKSRILCACPLEKCLGLHEGHSL